MTKLQERIKELEKKILSKGDSKKDMEELIEMLENPSKEIKDEILYTQYLIGKLQGLKEGAKLTKEEIIEKVKLFLDKEDRILSEADSRIAHLLVSRNINLSDIRNRIEKEREELIKQIEEEI